MPEATFRALEDYDSERVTVVVADTQEELAERLLEALKGSDNEHAVFFDGHFPFQADQRFLTWLASSRPISYDPASDFVAEDVEFDGRLYGGGEGEGPRLDISTGVGRDTGHRIVIGSTAYALIRHPSGTHWLFTPDVRDLLASESWDNGWGSATRYLGIRHDGLLESGCTFEEGFPGKYSLSSGPQGDRAIAQAVIGFNRRDNCGFTIDIEAPVRALLDSYLTGEEPDFEALGLPDSIELSGSYHLTKAQQDDARHALELQS